VEGRRVDAERGWKIDAGFDLEGFLARPLVARLATAGPTVRPLWYLWEEQAFWWLTGDWSRLPRILADDSKVALVVDDCDLRSGEVLQVICRGRATVVPLDAGRARRKLRRYLGDDESSWDERFLKGTFAGPSVRFVRLVPSSLIARDLSFRPATPRQ
jgi:nitroimidazol reductase NimA-like FMN-containing flavoprotein (pyridoxamine 5'-phosphate oxidase superfamily)